MLTHKNTREAMPERTVIIGSGGFIGDRLTKRLIRDGAHVVPITSRDIDLTVSTARQQLEGLLRPSDAVVMLACRTPDKGRDLGTALQNVQMGYHLAEALNAIPCQHVVYFSSDAVYGEEAELVSDDTKAEPSSSYGAMHLGREVVLQALMRDRLAIVRPTMVYGPGDTHNAYGPNRFLRTAADEGVIKLFGGGEELRDYIFIDDLIDLTVRILARRSAGTVLGATGRSYSFREVADLVAQRVRHRSSIVSAPRPAYVTGIRHRRFDVAATKEAFPALILRTLEEGLAGL